MKVYITRKIPAEAVKFLKQKKYKVKVYEGDETIPQNILIKEAADADGIISLLTDKFTPAVIDKLIKCKVIANYAVGYNNIDINYAKSKNITVTNTPDILTDATADITMALVLACARRIVEGEKFMRDKKFTGWKPELLLGYDLKNKYFGIIGAGRIGTSAAIRAAAFGCRILYYSRSKNKYLEQKTGAVKVSLNKIISTSDFLSLHLPLTPETFHLLNKEKLGLMKKSAVIVNTSRGEIIDEKSLITHLKKKKIFAAGFDVYEGEPKINPSLFELDNVVLLPHIGSATIETRRDMAILCAKNISAVLEGKKAITPVK